MPKMRDTSACEVFTRAILVDDVAADAEQRAAFLAKAGALLSESLDYEETFARLGRLCVRGLADWCAIDVVEGREIWRLAVAHRDPSKEPLFWQVQERYPPRWDSPHLAAKVLRTGEPPAASSSPSPPTS